MAIRVDLSGLPKAENETFLPLFRDRKRFLVLKGGAGSGKSYFAADKLICRCLCEQHPVQKHRFLVCRKVARTLRQSCFELIAGRIARLGFAPLFRYSRTGMEIVCKNGNRMLFAGLDDAEKLKSVYDITGIWGEEASEFRVEDIRQLNLRLRGRSPYYKQIMLSFNPISYSNWLRGEFFTDPPREDTTIHNSTYLDNRFIDDAYRAQLESYRELAPYYYQVYVQNEWGSAAGACFPEFRNNPNPERAWTHVIRPFVPPESWRVLRSFDFGYSKPFSVGWWAADRDGRVYRILELYGSNGEPNVGARWTPHEIARRIAEIERTHTMLRGRRVLGVADPSIWDASRGQSVAEMMEKAGVYFDRGDNKRIPGKMQLHYRLAFDGAGIPMLYVFDTCRAFIRTLPELVYDARNPEDVDTACEDHCYDETRYLCQMNPIAPPVPQSAGPAPFDPLSAGDEIRPGRYDWVRTY